MVSRWRMYWLALISLLFGVVLWKNHKYYKEKSKAFKVTKTTVETSILASAAMWLPGILIVYGSAWVTKPLEHRPYIRMGLAAIASIVLLLSMTYVLELVVLIGVFAIELLSGDFLKYMQERHDKRAQAEATQVA